MTLMLAPLLVYLSACAPQRATIDDSRAAAQSEPSSSDTPIQEPDPQKLPPAALEARQSALGETRSGPLILEELLSLALENNPTLQQASAQVAAERGKALQAGLYPNPRVGYRAEQIGVGGTAGEFQGGFIRQEIVTAGKLGLSREKYLARASVVELQALAQQYRVLNDVRIHYYRTLGAKKRLAIQKELLKTAEDQLLTVNEMRNVGQANEADLHQARVRLQEQRLNVEMAQNELAMARETLLTIVGVERSAEPLAGALEGEARPLQWDGLLTRLLDKSPELAATRAKLEADRITLRREQVEPIPNIFVEGATGYNFEARETVYGAGVTVEVPLFDWNQGTVDQAKADLRRQQAEVRLTELQLRRTLAEQYQRYRTARQHVIDFRDIILPQAKQRYITQLDSYQADRETWPAVLEAQTDFFNLRLAYINRLVEWREAKVAIEGLLLVNGLEPAASATPPGHIDAVPKPR